MLFRITLIASILALLLCPIIIVGYPIAAMVEHGFNSSLWPGPDIAAWIGFLNFNWSNVASQYRKMLLAESPHLSGGGFSQLLAILSPLPLVALLLWKPRARLQRIPNGEHGDARFASSNELRRQRQGLELGRDPASGRPVRVKVEGSLITFAAPRTGKTSGLILPNLARAERDAWDGPVVVLDTKGEIYKATADRRRALGRRVVCLDPTGLVGGRDHWNPLAEADPEEILYLQRTARALLPGGTARDGNNEYFQNSAVNLLVGVLLAALTIGKATPNLIAELLRDRVRLIATLEGLGYNSSAWQALTILQAEDRVREPIEATAQLALSWLNDPRLAMLVSRNTFKLADLATGKLDLFITYPSSDGATLSPFFRWLLMDIFSIFREEENPTRIVIFADEAANLGQFDELLAAASELPGRGVSLWTFWQDRNQVISLYGADKAQSLSNNAEILSFSDLPAADPAQLEHFSEALGSYTATITSQNDAGQQTTQNSTQAVRLMTPTDLQHLSARKLIVLSNSPRRPKHPMVLDKTVSFKDARFRRFLRDIKPVA